MPHGENNDRENRLFFLNNLRTFIVFLVVFYHAGWVYEKSGWLSSVWIVDDPSKNDLPGILNMILDIFMMPVIFFISGYFTPLSLKTRKGWDFIKYRFNRLMVPWITAVLTLIPLYKVIFLYSRNLPCEPFFSYFHFSGGILINQGWLWFLPVLFLFDLVYFVLWKLNPFTLKVSLKGAVFIIFLVGVIYSVFMSSLKYYGWTKTILLDFQNERLFIYFTIFLLGALCCKLDVFTIKPVHKRFYYFICFTIWIPMNLYIIFLLNLLFNPGRYFLSEHLDVMLTWFGFHLSLLGLLYITINTFRFYMNRKTKITDRLNTCSYGVYIIHFIVMGAIALMMRPVAIPSLAKYIILAVSTYLVSNLILFSYKAIVQALFQK